MYKNCDKIRIMILLSDCTPTDIDCISRHHGTEKKNASIDIFFTCWCRLGTEVSVVMTTLLRTVLYVEINLSFLLIGLSFFFFFASGVFILV